MSQPVSLSPFHPCDPIAILTAHLHITSLSYCYSLHIQSAASFSKNFYPTVFLVTPIFFKFIHGKLVCSNTPELILMKCWPCFGPRLGSSFFISDKAAFSKFSWPRHITYITIHSRLNLTLLSPKIVPTSKSHFLYDNPVLTIFKFSAPFMFTVSNPHTVPLLILSTKL